ncbi:MAG: phage/plasmid primase, P4 family [Afipia sp.]
MTKRDDDLFKARRRAADVGGSVSHHLDDVKRERRRPKWSYGSGEALLGNVIVEFCYNLPDGEPYLLVQKTEDKQFRQSHWDGNGWKPGKPRGPKIPYMLPNLLQSSDEEPVFICEGEKDAETVIDLGLVGTSASEGAGKWTKDLNRWFERKAVAYILSDNDEYGRRHAAKVARNLALIVPDVRIINLPGLEEGEDVSDWIQKGGTREELLRLATSAHKFEGIHAVLNPQDPYGSARIFLEQDFTDGVGLRMLHRFRGAFYVWERNRYRSLSDEEIQAKTWKFLNRAVQVTKHGESPFRPSRAKVAEVISALSALTQLSKELDTPVWLTRTDDVPPAAELFACENGLLHLPTGMLLPASSDFFNLTASDVVFNPNVGPPDHFFGFLDQLFGDDAEAKQALQEFFGYFLSPDTSQQKILLIVGPKRSGKGTIGRVLRGILGSRSVAGPTMSSFSERFGLEPLVSKSLAIIADARIGQTTNKSAITERLLSISGEDQFTVDRKFASAWHGKLPTRLAIFTNELPSLNDGAGALAGRFILINLSCSFFGREDTSLSNKISGEMSGILNWAIDGYRSLLRRGNFVQPKSSLEAINEIEMLGSPILAFVQDCCEVGPGFQVSGGEIWDAYQTWANTQQTRPSNKQWFGRNLRSAVPGLIISKPRRTDGERELLYVGLRLNANARQPRM